MVNRIFFVLSLVISINSVSGFEFRESFMLDTVTEWKNYAENQRVVNEKCVAQLTEYIKMLFAEKSIYLDNWAWRMFDASHKLNPGILNGNTLGTGDMDECLAINVMHEDTMHIKGKYCYPGIVLPLPPRVITEPPKVSNRQSQVFMPQAYFAAICIPHECKLEELIEPMPGMDTSLICQTDDTFKEFDGGDWAFISFLLVIVLLIFLSTCYDWQLRHRNQKTTRPITLAFSFYTNGEKLIKLSNNPEQISCLNGIRALSMIWVMAGHRYAMTFNVAVTNLEQALEWSKEPYSQYIQGAPVAVDTFLFITGVLTAYSFLKSQSKPKARFNIFMYYLHRYLRLTPAIAVLWFFFVTLYKHTSSGPMWPMGITMQVDDCMEAPYSYFLYIQNFVNPNRMCLMHTWYLSVDMQIFIFSPIILIPMVKYPKYAGHTLVGLILLSVLPPILITYFMDILAYGPDYNKHYYFQPYTRISPWLIGVLLGYIFYQLRDRKIKISKGINLLVWVLMLGGMIAIIYVGAEQNLTEDILSFAFYNGLHRMFWAVGLMWIVFACKFGYGGMINWFLSLPPFEILGKISYSMYLLHTIVQMMEVMNLRTPFHFSDFQVLNQCFGDILTISVLAFFYCLMFESPMVTIEKIIFDSPKRSQPKTEPQQERTDTIIEAKLEEVRAGDSVSRPETDVSFKVLDNETKSD